ncbi:unnamed protein product [Caenorhabditis bovis]|uniref:Uncharacterized protein n=1 Tax=Caenorhabditis bovis TaxID=2654633 RepID=A0A8S1F0V0_9PELO|nr:unnamed protein product [Caenorhabditis bovis]
MPLARIARAFHYFIISTRYLFSDSRQRIVAYVLIFLCFLTPSSSSFILYQGTTPKFEYLGVESFRQMSQVDRRTVYSFCKLVVLNPDKINLNPRHLLQAKPICEQFILGLKKFRELEKSRHNLQGSVL